MTIEMVFPFAENREVIGLNYADRPDQMAAIRKALLSRAPVVDGPIPLVQGGSALMVYYPLYEGANTEAWGILTSMVDVNKLLSSEPIAAGSPPLHLALGKDGANGKPDDILFGDPEIFQMDPVTHKIKLANTTWTIAAAPKAGWSPPISTTIARRLLIDSVGVLIIIFVLGIATLLRERNRNISTLKAREAELQRLSQRMSFALEASRIGVWDMDVESGEAIWDERMYTLYGEPKDCAKNGLQVWSDRLHPEDRQN